MLKVECESCKAPYQVDERRVPPTGLKMRCPKCGHTFLVTDPSKGAPPGGADGGIPKPPPPKKATMVGVGAFGPGGKPIAPPPAPAAAAKPAAPAPPAIASPPLDVALPAVKPAAPANKPLQNKPTAPAMPAPIPPAALPGLDDLDLPALAGDVGLPAAVNRPGPGAPKAPAPPPPANNFSFEMDLPAVSPPASGGFGPDLPVAKNPPGFGPDLPSPKGGGGFGSIDLPAPKHGGFADLPMVANDLPAVGAGNLPMAKGGGGFGEIDLPSLQNDLPQSMGANAHLPQAMGANAHLPQAMGANAHLPQAMGANAHLPSAMGANAHMPMPVSDDRLLPNRGGPAPIAFGELDLPLVGEGGAAPPPPAQARSGDPVSFGELDLPADPSIAVNSPLAAQSGSAGGMGFGEVDLGGGNDAGPPVMGPPPATSAGTFAFQEASLEASQPPKPAERPRREMIDRPASKAPKILAVAVLLLVLGGAALQLVPGVGAFGYIAITDKLNSGNYARSAAEKGDEARKKLAADTFPVAQAAADDLADAKKRSPRSRPLAAYAALVEYTNEVRFGADPARAARVSAFITEIPANTEVPYLKAAQAAQVAAAGDFVKARTLVDAAIQTEPKDGVQQDLAFLKGEIALATRDNASAVAAFTQTLGSAPSARAHYGLARAHYHARAYTKSRESVDAALKLTPKHAGALTLRALLTWEMQRDDQAAVADLTSVLDNANRKNLGPSEISSALAAKGVISFARDRAGEARAAFDEAVKIDPRNVTALVGQGEVLYADGRPTEAHTRFEEAMRKDPSSVQATIGVAKSKLALEQLADAKSLLTQARGKFAKEMGIALWLAKVEEQLGNRKAAEELYASAIDLADPQNPDAVQAYAAMAKFLASQGKTAEAQAKLDQARTKLPDTAALQRAFGDVAVAQGQYDEAVAHYQAALQKTPNDLGTRFRLGSTFRKMKRLDDAARVLDEVAAIDKEYPNLALERGLLFEQAGETQKALEQFNGAYQKAPNDVDLMLHVGAAYVAIGEVDKALPLLLKVKDQRPNSPVAQHYIGRAYLRQGGLEAALAMRFLQRAVDLDPNQAEYHLYVAWAANESTPAQLGLARKHVDKALQLDKLLADAYWQRGVVEVAEGQINDAIKDLKRALELKPSRHEAHATLAMAYGQKNDPASALSEWQKAIAGDDKNATWRWQYGRLLADKNQNAEAVKHLTYAVEKGKAAQPRPGWLGPAAFEAGEVLRKTGNKKDACEHYHLYMELAAPTSADRRDAIKAMNDMGCPWEGR